MELSCSKVRKEAQKMRTWRSASAQEWQKVLVEEEDREELGVMTSRNGHICQQKGHCS